MEAQTISPSFTRTRKGAISHLQSRTKDSYRFPQIRGIQYRFFSMVMTALVLSLFGFEPVTAQTVLTSQVPTNENFDDPTGPYELGMTFSSTSAGNITAIRHWKAADDNAPHVGRVWDALGNLLAEITFADNAGSGYKQQALIPPLQIEADTVYTVSVNSGAAGDNGSFYPFGGDLPVTNGDLTGIQGVFINAPGGFPETPSVFHYFRDVVFEAGDAPIQIKGKCIIGEKFVRVGGAAGPLIRNSITEFNSDENAANPLIASVPAQNLDDLPMAFFGGEPVLYEFKIRNCGDVNLLNVRVDDCADGRSVGDPGFLAGGANGNCVEDPRLIPFSPPRIVSELLEPGESVTVTSADFPQDPISSIDLCETFGRLRGSGIVRNNSQVEGDADLNGNGLADECTDEEEGVCRGASGNPAFVFFDDLNLVQCKDQTPAVEIEKFTNGFDADDANGFPVASPPSGPGFPDDIEGDRVPVVAIGDTVSWTYVVTNRSSETLNGILVTDSQGVDVVCPADSLAAGESLTCTATGVGLNLAENSASVPGCSSQGQGMSVPAYENLGKVVAVGADSGIEVSAEDPSHYCNPPQVTIEKFTNGYDGDQANGIATEGQGNFEIGAPQVAEIAVGETVTWTYIVSNSSSENLTGIEVSDSRGAAVTCPSDTLAPGESFMCTASATADDLLAGDPNVPGCGAGKVETRPTYQNLGLVLAKGGTTGLTVEDDDPSHYCNPSPPPPCGLKLEKSCKIERPKPPSAGKCKGRLRQFTVIWDGADGTSIRGVPNSTPDGIVNNGDVVTFFGPFRRNDVFVKVGRGWSVFHTSCSDKDMDGDTRTDDDQKQVAVPPGRDCGKFQGNGKGSKGINQWLLEGFVDKRKNVLDCTVDTDPGDPNCTIQQTPADCRFPVKKPDKLTFRVTGGDCRASKNGQRPHKTKCWGDAIDADQPVKVFVNRTPPFDLKPGETFNVRRKGTIAIKLIQDKKKQFNAFHGSCSQPLRAGDRYGANELVALDGAGLGANVLYSYRVSNEGPQTLTDITVTDDKLGELAASPILSLAPGETQILQAKAFISKTTMNTGMAVASPTCTAKSEANVVVMPPPPCRVKLFLDEIDDDEIEWKLVNVGETKATLKTLNLEFPGALGAIKEIKLDHRIFKSSRSDTYPSGVPSGATLESKDWTERELSKRQVNPRAKEELEIKFKKDIDDDDLRSKDFNLLLTFKEGCSVSYPGEQ